MFYCDFDATKCGLSSPKVLCALGDRNVGSAYWSVMLWVFLLYSLRLLQLPNRHVISSGPLRFFSCFKLYFKLNKEKVELNTAWDTAYSLYLYTWLHSAILQKYSPVHAKSYYSVYIFPYSYCYRTLLLYFQASYSCSDYGWNCFCFGLFTCTFLTLCLGYFVLYFYFMTVMEWDKDGKSKIIVNKEITLCRHYQVIEMKGFCYGVH